MDSTQCWSLLRGSPSLTLGFRYEMTQKTLGLTTSSWPGEGRAASSSYILSNDSDLHCVCMHSPPTSLHSQFHAHVNPTHPPSQSAILRYSNNHMGYFATAREYQVGGYESLLTMWGEGTANRVRQSIKTVASHIKP